MVICDETVDATIESVDYRILNDQIGEANVQFPFLASTQQRFFFDSSLAEVKAIVVANASLQLNLSPRIVLYQPNPLFNITISDPYYDASHHQNQTSTYLPQNAYYTFREGIEIKVLNANHIYAQEQSNKSLNKTISGFIETANRLAKTFTIQLPDNKLVVIGQGKHEIFYTNGLAESHLIGNGGENVYVVSPNNSTVLPLPEIVLYDINKEFSMDWDELYDTLDLREVIKKAKDICSKQVILPDISPSGGDLIISLNAYYHLYLGECIYLSGFTWPIARIRLKNALNGNWYQKLNVVLEDTSMNILALEDSNWRLVKTPLAFVSDKTIIVFTQKTIKAEPEAIIFKNIGNYTFIRNNNTDLILTNFFNTNTSPWNLCTVLYSQFYQIPEMREKVLATTLHFFDQEIVLADHKEQINNASDFSFASNLHMEEPTNSPLLNRASDVASSRDNQVRQPDTLARYKRQLDSYTAKRSANHLRANLDDSYAHTGSFTLSGIEEAANDYLDKYDAKENKKNRSVQYNRKITKKNVRLPK